MITLLTSGTRGDVTPYIALGLGLQAAGRAVRLSAPEGFGDLVRAAGLPFAPFRGNPSDLLIAAEQKNALTLGRNPLASLQASLSHLREARPLYRAMLASAFEACQGSQQVLYGLPSLWGWHLAEALGAQPVRALLQPLSPTHAFPSALLPFRFSLGKKWNRFSAWMVAQLTWLAWRGEINRWRATVGLPPAPVSDPALLGDSARTLTLHGFSQSIVPRPEDWPESHHITGYWQYHTKDWHPPAELHAFLEKAPRPLAAIGFGSPGSQFSRTLGAVHAALRQPGFSAVVTLPSIWHDSVRAENIYPLEYAPHDWLYRHVDVIVHHGGAGTTASALFSGRPQVLLPLAIDQFFWAERIEQLGAGPKAIPQRRLTAKNFAHALQDANETSAYGLTARTLEADLSIEDGITAAVRLLV